MNHVQLKCDCDNPNGCNVCNLFVCAICGGAEGDLPTECPGYKMTGEQRESIYGKRLDFIGGKWIQPPQRVPMNADAK